MNYHQPDFYHFTQDSLTLVNYVTQKLQHQQVKSFLDICAGCGVIGIELALKLNLARGTFIEVQPDFRKFIIKNCETFHPTLKYEMIIDKFSHCYLENNADVCVANPPYFITDNGRLSPDMHKRICRHFVHDTKELFLETLKRLKESTPHIYFLFREEIQDVAFEKVFHCHGQTFIYTLT